MSVGWLIGRAVHLFVDQSVTKEWEVTLPCSYRSTCYIYWYISRVSGWIVLATATSINVLIAGELTVDLNIFLYLLNSLPSYLSLCPPVHRSIYLMPICLSPRANAPCMGYLFLGRLICGVSAFGAYPSANVLVSGIQGGCHENWRQSGILRTP